MAQARFPGLGTSTWEGVAKKKQKRERERERRGRDHRPGRPWAVAPRKWGVGWDRGGGIWGPH